MKSLPRHLLWFAATAVAVGLLITVAGLVPVAASKGHWAPVKRFLHFTMQRSVRTQARGIAEAPELDQPALIRRGAGTYAHNCALCHGAPDTDRASFARLMIPPAPELPPKISDWQTHELFWIVRHGIKYTAMPAWAASQRSDEVWAVVAFLRQMPGMSEQRYESLAYGNANPDGGAASTGLSACMHCHGIDGGGRRGTAPRLAGQKQAYLRASLREYADGRRPSGIMQPIAAALSERRIDQLAVHFSRLPPPPAVATESDREAAARGAQIARNGIAQRDVAPCDACHAPADGTAHPRYPWLNGQDADYLVEQLRLFRNRVRAQTPAAALMAAAARGLTAAESRDVSLYYQSAQTAPTDRAARADDSGHRPASGGHAN